MLTTPPVNLFLLPPKRVHIMGICGVGAAGIAWMLHLRGWKVSGCDRHIPPAMKKFFERHGIFVTQDHNPAHLTECDALVYSAAVKADEPELIMARNAGIPVLSRGECLAGWIGVLRTIAVCGTHGKTTTSCFTTRLLQCIGQAPFWCLGGYTSRLHTNAGPILGEYDCSLQPEQIAVAEADESDGTLAYDYPAVTVITNIDLDHLDHFQNAEEIEQCFTAVVEHTKEYVVVCADAPRAMRVVTRCRNGAILTYGFNESAMLRAEVQKRLPDSTDLRLWIHGELLGEITLPIPGDHNVLNALGAMAAVLSLGFPVHELIKALPQACSELPKRRFQWMTPQTASIRAVIDYAHHPAEIQAMLSMARLQNPKRLRIVFQPHRFSRTLKFLDEFVEALRGEQEVILLPVYAASEDIHKGCDSYELYAAIRAAASEQQVVLARDIHEVLHYLRQSAQEGDLFLIVGAGDVEKIGQQISENPLQPHAVNPTYAQLSECFTSEEVCLRPNESLAKHTFFRTGGIAEVYAEPRSIAALVALTLYCKRKHIPIHLAGGGSNSWFSDLGLPGVLCSLRGEAFESYQADGEIVTAGAGMTGAALLSQLEREGRSGLEFMQGIPGTVGGWTRMNAGAHQHAIWEFITAVRVLEHGRITHITAQNFTSGYRSVRGLDKMIVLTVSFRLPSGTPAETIRQTREAYAQKRIPLTGLNTCGSLFRNDSSCLAGAMLDQLGAKQWRIGDAFVTSVHANVIAAGNACNGSDLLALMQRMRHALKTATQIDFIPEIHGFSAESKNIYTSL